MKKTSCNSNRKRYKENCTLIQESTNSESAEPLNYPLMNEDYEGQILLTNQRNSTKDQIWDNIDDYDDV
jgi:hypothetical protein